MPPRRDPDPREPSWKQSVLTASQTLKREFDLGTLVTQATDQLANALGAMEQANAKLPGGGESLAVALEQMATQVRRMNQPAHDPLTS